MLIYRKVQNCRFTSVAIIVNGTMPLAANTTILTKKLLPEIVSLCTVTELQIPTSVGFHLNSDHNKPFFTFAKVIE
jgi:hypothetical protein